MLQRKQTLFLLLAVLCGALTFVFPVDTFTRGDHSYIFRTTGLFTGEGVPVQDVATKVPFAVLLGVLSGILLAVVFMYRNRIRQMRLLRMMNLLMLAIVVFLFITDNSIRVHLAQGGRVANQFGLSAILPLGMIIFTFLADRSIRKDEELVKSMDRLR